MRIAEKPLAVICLAGPTGSGKTSLALGLANALGCEIVNADSRQTYSDFPVITAQPTEAEQSICPHHLYGFLPINEKTSAGQWVNLALAKCAEITSRGHIPLLTGGTGFYFEAMLGGLACIPSIDPAIGQELAAKLGAGGTAPLYALLQKTDQAWAEKIHPHDSQRILRALEVWLGTGRNLSWWHAHAAQNPPAAGPLLVLSANLAWLVPRLRQRIDLMLAQGALEEATRAAAKNADPRSPGWSGIGCSELLAFLKGKFDLGACKDLWLANTRAYAKRQLTWFRGRKKAIWITPNDQKAALQAIAANFPINV